ncbi:hypothetical protein K8R47_00235 [archaeon]|nr:hypothetical protein [archaeon]
MDHKFHKKRKLRHLVSAILMFIILPFIVLLDIFVEIYHQIGFRLCNIPLVNRKSYIKIDRHKLKYLNWSNKFACAYCGYANGFVGYIGEIAARTEQYWCAIKHKKAPNFHEQQHQKNFLKYGDEKAFKKKYR